ncbi:synaptophysin-like [Clavelina lepadiformis]|uniref:synaptophysin-like n=1 Tax=Clavelina lepadiformis TaxID=159417 RepID=UPI004042998A
MDTSSWRIRAVMEPRGFIRVIEIVLAIVAFATTGGYHSTAEYAISCPSQTIPNLIPVPISYPFHLNGKDIAFDNCSGNTTTTRMEGNLSPSAQWFMFVGVTAFLYSLAAVIFYVMFDAKVRQTHERAVTITDLAVTVIYTFLWLTAASAWAWGLGEVKKWTSQNRFFSNSPLDSICNQEDTTCSIIRNPDFTPLNASVAFAFLNFFLWGCNCWFVYKESPYHQEPAKDNAGAPPQPPNNM